MPTLHASKLVPFGLAVETATFDDDKVLIAVRSDGKSGRCPVCARGSDRVHSRYRRTLADLPAAGRQIVLILTARRFFCDDRTCRQRIFAERFEGAIVPKALSTSTETGPRICAE
jgi:transposase